MTISAEEGLIRQGDYFNRVVASSDLSTYYLLERGDFAYNKSYSNGYPVGAIRRLDRYARGVVSPLYICFRPDSRKIDSDFLRHYFAAGRVDSTIAFVAKEGARNHGLLNVALADFFGVPVEIPPLGEQRRLAKILDALDHTVRSTENLIAKLEQVKQGVLHDLLTRGIDDDGQLRDPAHSPEDFVDTDMGKMPRSWKIVELGEVADVHNGTTPSRVRADYWTEGTIPWLASGKVNDYRIASPSELITRRAVDETSLRVLPAGAIVIGMIGEGRTRGMSARLEIKATINQNLAGVIPGADLDPVYCHVFLHSHYARLRGGGRGSNQDALNTSLVARFPIALPPLEEQVSIAEVVRQAEVRLDHEAEALSKLHLLKAGLMGDLLTGRVRVTVDEDAA